MVSDEKHPIKFFPFVLYSNAAEDSSTSTTTYCRTHSEALTKAVPFLQQGFSVLMVNRINHEQQELLLKPVAEA